MREHELKTLADYWDAVASGEKTFEVRRDDRGFQKGDVLTLVRVEMRDFASGGARLVRTNDILLSS